MRSALVKWPGVGVVREHAKASVKYNYENTQARAVVLPIIDQIVRDAGKNRLGHLVAAAAESGKRSKAKT